MLEKRQLGVEQSVSNLSRGFTTDMKSCRLDIVRHRPVDEDELKEHEGERRALQNMQKWVLRPLRKGPEVLPEVPPEVPKGKGKGEVPEEEGTKGLVEKTG